MADKLNADRISRMVDAILKAAGGDYSVRLDTDDKENDVLASLAEAINNMLGATGEQISNMRQSEAGCRQVVEAINDALAVCDANGVLTYANQHFCEILSARTEELIGSKFVDLLGETNRNRWLEQQERRKQGIATSYQLEIPSRDGSNILCAASDSALVDNDGRLIGSICVLTDITQRRREEEALRMFQFSIDQAPDAVFWMNRDAGFSYVNEQACRSLGYTREELLSMSVADIDPDFPSEVWTQYWQQLLQNRDQTFETIHQRKDGSRFPVEITANYIEFGGKEYSCAYARDLTEPKRSEEQQKKLRDQLRQTQKMEAIGTLAGGIAHDFNNILSAIMGYTEIALSEAEKQSSLYANLREVFQAGERAKNLVKQILAFSRQAEQEIKPVQVRLIAKEALRFLRASLPTTIEIHQNNLSDSLVMADPTQIHQVIMNLCTNAGHAMREKGGVLGVKLTDVELDTDFTEDHPETKPGTYLELSVSDTGHGMSKRILNRIFDPFFTTKGKGEGTGMGLAVVHGIVGSYDGMITASSEPGHGSTFKIYLPAVKRQLEQQTESAEPIPTGTERILFVDDEPALVYIGKQTLEPLGYQVTTRTSSIEALELFKAKPDGFDLVITDMTMPNMTGDDLAGEMMQIRPETPIILCTGYSAQINQQQAMAMGVRAFVSKPVLIRDLAETIRKVLEKK